MLTCVFNRNYVRPELYEATLTVAKNMNDRFEGTTTNYLDANFPFINKFPLIPHISHNDGKKLDLSFFYRDAKTNVRTKDCPSFIGYGICEGPLPGEKNAPEYCYNKGYTQYSYLTKMVPQGNKSEYIFDAIRTKELVNLFTKQDDIGKIFIEPHLKTRLRINSKKNKISWLPSSKT